MNEDESSDPFQIEVTPNGVPEGVSVVVFLIMAAVIGFLLYQTFGITSNVCKVSDMTARVQSEAAKAQADAGAAVQKRVVEMQVKIMEGCIASKGLPILVNGNVDCKKQ